MTNPLVTWLPATAAAALLIAAGYAMTTDAGDAGRVADADDDFPRTEEPDELAADHDDDGTEMLAAMENRLVHAGRILTTAKDAQPTKEGLKAIKSINWNASQDLLKLRRMKNNVSDEVFERGDKIAQEISDKLRQVQALWETAKKQREAARQQPQQAPQQAQQAPRAPYQAPQPYTLPPQAPQPYTPPPQPYTPPPQAPQPYTPPQSSQYDDPEQLDEYRGEDE